MLGDFSRFGSLAPGDSYTRTADFVLPVSITGVHYVHVWSDVGNNVFEFQAEDNNTGTSNGVAVTLRPPDLVVEEVTAPAEFTAGSTSQLQWKVRNAGPGPTFETSWQDRIYLSPDPVLAPTGATLLGSFVHTATLGAGAAYTQSQLITIPNGINGSFYLHVWTDALEQVFEANAEAANVSSRRVTVTLGAPPDLIVADVSVSAGATAGWAAAIRWTVINAGAGASTGSWEDRIYLSRDNVLDAADIVLGAYSRTAPLAVGASYVQTRTVVLPDALPAGSYTVFVVTDAAGSVYEASQENNNAGSGRADVAARTKSNLVVKVATAPAAANAGQAITVAWTVLNDSSVSTWATSWLDTIYLSSDSVFDSAADLRIAASLHKGALGAGAAYSLTQMAVLPNGISGEYTLFLVADSGGQTDDANRADNVAVVQTGSVTPGATIGVILGPLPDLSVAQIAAPVAATAGQPLAITWDTHNAGAGAANGAWYDSIYFSYDASLDAADVQLSSQFHGGPLTAGSVYTTSRTINIPGNATGAYYLLFKTDSRNDVYEHAAEDNNLAAWPVEVSVLPPADLHVANVTAPLTAEPGSMVTVEWQVENLGANAATGYACDAVFVSADSAWDINDSYVGESCRYLDLAAGAAGLRSMLMTMPAAAVLDRLTSSLPGATPGQYYAIVRADIRNYIPESDEGNNAAASANTIAVDVAELALDATVNTTLDRGQARYYRIRAAAGETLLFSLVSDSPTAANELYVRYGQAPSRGSFDYSYGAPLEANQEVVIPETVAGDYYVLVYADSVAEGVETIRISAARLVFGIRSLSTSVIGNEGTATVRINGAKFDQDTWFAILDAGGSPVAVSVSPTDTLHVDSATSYATFKVEGLAPNSYQLVAYKQGTTSAPVPLTIVSGGGKLVFDVDAPANARPNQPLDIVVNYQNVGVTDLLPPLIVVQSPSNNELLVVESNIITASSDLLLLGLPNDTFFGVLAPNTAGTLHIRTNATTAAAELNVHVLDPVDVPFDREGSAAALESDEAGGSATLAIESMSIFDQDKAIFDRSMAELRYISGETWGDVRKRISEEARVAGERVVVVRDWVTFQYDVVSNNVEQAKKAGVDIAVGAGKWTIATGSKWIMEGANSYFCDPGSFNAQRDITVTLESGPFSATLPTLVIVHGLEQWRR